MRHSSQPGSSSTSFTPRCCMPLFPRKLTNVGIEGFIPRNFTSENANFTAIPEQDVGKTRISIDFFGDARARGLKKSFFPWSPSDPFMKGEYLTVFCTSPDLKNARRVLDRLVKDRLVDRDLEG